VTEKLYSEGTMPFSIKRKKFSEIISEVFDLQAQKSKSEGGGGRERERERGRGEERGRERWRGGGGGEHARAGENIGCLAILDAGCYVFMHVAAGMCRS
jgi:hypothetical protein